MFIFPILSFSELGVSSYFDDTLFFISEAFNNGISFINFSLSSLFSFSGLTCTSGSNVFVSYLPSPLVNSASLSFSSAFLRFIQLYILTLNYFICYSPCQILKGLFMGKFFLFQGLNI